MDKKPAPLMDLPVLAWLLVEKTNLPGVIVCSGVTVVLCVDELCIEALCVEGGLWVDAHPVKMMNAARMMITTEQITNVFSLSCIPNYISCHYTL
jgi:hypothetical protein